MKPTAVSYWKDKKEKLLKKYNNLTDKDLKFNLGNEEKMIEILGQKLGKTKKELLSIKGFGEKKVEKYGDEILRILNE